MQSTTWRMRATVLLLVKSGALLTAACGSPVGVSANTDEIVGSTREIVGISLVGARGESLEDQTKIDTTVTRLCATGVWTEPECLRHDLETQGETN